MDDAGCSRPGEVRPGRDSKGGVTVLLAQGLSAPAVAAIYVLIPLAVTGVIFALVFTFSRPDSHGGSQVLGHPADLSRRERDGQPPAPGSAAGPAAPEGSGARPADGGRATPG